MPENFYTASRFATMEQAGEAYTAVQEMLRSEGDTDLSVYRFEVRGVAHVVVLGIEGPARITAAINDALGRGEPAILEDEAIAWLFDRRGQQAQPDTFREGHYTRETGPRPRPVPRDFRRRRVSTLEVTWQDEVPGPGEAGGTLTDLRTGNVFRIPAQHSGVCDWCTAELAPPVAAIHNFGVEMEFPDGFTTGTGGKWATCSMCQDRLRLKPGDSQVAFDLVDRLWRIHGSRYLGEYVRQLRIRTFYAEGPYGEGQEGG